MILKTEEKKVDGKLVRCREVRRGFVRPDDVVEGSAGYLPARETSNPCYAGMRIGWQGTIEHVRVWRHVDSAFEAKERVRDAAPALLDALKAVVAEYRDGYGLKCFDQVQTALKKAGVS